MFLFYFQHNDLHASWKDYHSKFSEHPSSHSYNIKEIEKKFVLMMGTLKIYSFNLYTYLC